MTEKTAIQRIKELDQERAALFEQAKEEALRRANQAVEDQQFSFWHLMDFVGVLRLVMSLGGSG